MFSAAVTAYILWTGGPFAGTAAHGPKIPLMAVGIWLVIMVPTLSFSAQLSAIQEKQQSAELFS